MHGGDTPENEITIAKRQMRLQQKVKSFGSIFTAGGSFFNEKRGIVKWGDLRISTKFLNDNFSFTVPSRSVVKTQRKGGGI